MASKLMRAVLAGTMVLAGTGAANATALSFSLTGLFNLELGGQSFSNIPLTLSGKGSTAIGLTTSEGNPFILFSSLNAIVSGYGTFPVPTNIAFYFDPKTGPSAGEGGFIDFSTGKKVLILNSPSFTGYDGNSNLFTSGLQFDAAQGFSTPFGTAEVISADHLTLSASVPEAASWAMMLVGFGIVGGALRSRSVAFQSA